MAVCCAACYSRLKTANHEIANDPEVRRKVAEVVGGDYDGKTPVLHLLEILARDIGPRKIAERVKRPLQGLRVVSLLRLPAVAAAGGDEASTTPRTRR